MALIDLQTALGHLLRDQHGKYSLQNVHLDDGERRYLETLRTTAGFRFCASVQRSWCIGRAARSAQLTLSLLPQDDRQKLLDEWVDSGAGTQSFYEVEAESFFHFLSRRLRDPSHELSVCQFEQAVLRASAGANNFVAPDSSLLKKSDCALRRGRHASLVRFYADPGRLLDSLQNRQPLPPLSPDAMILIFSPGPLQLWHQASPQEVELWEALSLPRRVKDLSRRNRAGTTLKGLLECGAIEYVDKVIE